MGAGASASAQADAFAAQYAELPDDVHDMVEALCERDSMALLKPNGSSPPPFPSTLIGVKVQLDHDMASAVLAAVPRLQRKHYELIPKSLTELEFFISFFSHLTAIVNTNCPDAFVLGEEPEGSWKGVDTAEAATNDFDAAWLAMDDAKKAAVEAICTKESTALKAANPSAPPAFPTLPLGMKCFVDEAAATAALSTVKGLQYKHYSLVGPNKLPEKDFWVHFFSHFTAIATAA